MRHPKAVPGTIDCQAQLSSCTTASPYKGSSLASSGIGLGLDLGVGFGACVAERRYALAASGLAITDARTAAPNLGRWAAPLPVAAG